MRVQNVRNNNKQQKIANKEWKVLHTKRNLLFPGSSVHFAVYRVLGLCVWYGDGCGNISNSSSDDDNRTHTEWRNGRTSMPRKQRRWFCDCLTRQICFHKASLAVFARIQMPQSVPISVVDTSYSTCDCQSPSHAYSGHMATMSVCVMRSKAKRHGRWQKGASNGEEEAYRQCALTTFAHHTKQKFQCKVEWDPRPTHSYSLGLAICDTLSHTVSCSACVCVSYCTHIVPCAGALIYMNIYSGWLCLLFIALRVTLCCSHIFLHHIILLQRKGKKVS